jgi:predicted anti-sigma-YlaC factor YlaD
MTHITFERLSELAELGPDGAGIARDEEARHVASCAECRSTVSRVRSLLTAARALPNEVAPPPEVWTRLRARVGARSARRGPSWNWGRWIAAAASVVFIVGAALLIPGGRGKGSVSKAAPVQPSPAIARVELHFAGTLAELRATLDTQRTLYTPAAVNVVDRTLAVIDTAIAETRAAITDDPNNPALVRILSSHYERKVELLQRATELAPSS